LDLLQGALAQDWSFRAYGGFEFSILELLLPWQCLAATANPVSRKRLHGLTLRALHLGAQMKDPLVCEAALKQLKILRSGNPNKQDLQMVLTYSKLIKWREAVRLAGEFFAAMNEEADLEEEMDMADVRDENCA